MSADEWRCPSCELTWDELPIGHAVAIVTIGPGPHPPTECSTGVPLSPTEFVRLTSRRA